MDDSYRDSPAKSKRKLAALPTIPKRQRVVPDETGNSSQECKSKSVIIPDAVLISKTNSKVKVYEDYSCRLILPEEDKFFIMQIAVFNNRYAVFIRYGQLGEEGQWEAKREQTEKDAIKVFKKKFREKTNNGWNNRENFEPHPGKYCIQEEEACEEGEGMAESDAESEMQPLDSRTELMLRLILNNNMFTKQISVMKLDSRKVKPEKISERMLNKAEETLTNIEKALKARKPPSVVSELWAKFFKAVPHLDDAQSAPVQQMGEAVETFLHRKKDMMKTLNDIKLVWSILEQDPDTDLDLQEQYELLGCRLTLLEKDSEDFKLVKAYSEACKNSRKCTLLDVWSVNRPEEKARFEEHVGLHYRKLLWHGVNVASVAAILKFGLRITPFSGGNLGKGLYFTPEHAKSSWNVGVHWGKFEEERNVGFMFLVETALGRMTYIKMGNSSLTHPPEGFNSIAAKGRLEPDPSKDKVKMIDGMRVIVPVGPPEPQREFEASGFLHSEYVIYNEGQARIRYLVKFSFA